MAYRSTRQLVLDLQQHQQLLVIEESVDPRLELAEIHRRVFRNGGPALLFSNIQGCRFPVASNLFGTLERARFIFRDQIDAIQSAVRLKANPALALRKVWSLRKMPLLGWRMMPRVVSSSSVMRNQCKLSDLPQIVCWPKDGGAFVTLPQVLSRSPSCTGLNGLNLGMYRVQLSGNQYQPDQCGLHYQIHRGIGVHHTQALESGAEFPVSVSVGGTPAMTLAAVMPLPEGMSELGLAGALAGHRIPMQLVSDLAPIYADADFCIVGKVVPNQLKPEGPFGDHLGFYAKVHDFPYIQVEKVYHRDDAIWPMTVVGRPPQEDTIFGELIHELTGPMIPSVLPGVKQVHAVDAAGVHPLLLAVGSERYTPYQSNQRPQELLTQACAILGQGQLSLAKYLWIVDGNDQHAPTADRITDYFQYLLERVNWQRDLHFITQTTIDTLDYSGDGLNQGSKLIVACQRQPLRQLAEQLPSQLSLPETWRQPQLAMPGVLVVTGPEHHGELSTHQLHQQCDSIKNVEPWQQLPLVVMVDDGDFAARNLNNWLWVTFTRSNPAADIYGLQATTSGKHFGCSTVVIDARAKPHHAPGLFEDPQVSARVDAMAARGGPLAKYL